MDCIADEFTVCHLVSNLLPMVGVKIVVASSGSRSMPIVTALSANPLLKVFMVTDERVASFIALGISKASDEPVAIVCTSGSAVMNYGPALAEAYYSQTPIIAISADRPADAIDRNEAQTMRQDGALANVVKRWSSVSQDKISKEKVEAISTQLLDTLLAAITPRKGPVHVNIHLSEPLIQTYPESLPILPKSLLKGIKSRIDAITKQIEQSRLTMEQIAEYSRLASGKKVMIYIGPEIKFNKCRVPEELFDTCFLVSDVYDNMDFLMECATDDMLPDILITVGCAPMSRKFVNRMRKAPGLEHWILTDAPSDEDTYRCPYRNIVTTDFNAFFKGFDPGCTDEMTGFVKRWKELEDSAVSFLSKSPIPWSDLKAISILMRRCEANCMFASNGMTYRYLSLPTTQTLYSIYSNRGVNGIDGTTSTAVGVALAYPNYYYSHYQNENENQRTNLFMRPFLLLTGDMSAINDIGALFSGVVPPWFKMVVFNNEGGEIFRSIPSTRIVYEREKLLSYIPKIDWRGIAYATGMDYLEASDESSLYVVAHRFYNSTERPSLLVINTPPGNSIIYNKLMESWKNSIGSK